MPLSDEQLAKVLYVDLTSKRYRVERREDLFSKYLGGTGVAVQLIKEELDPKADPLSPENVVIIAAGVLTGAYPAASKLVAMFKSPLTGNLGESHAGGRAAIALRMSGFGALVIKGASEIPIYLSVHNGRVEFKDASALWGVRSSLTIGKVLREREPWPGLRSIMRIGRAGEKLVRYASVILETYRHFGRLGLGAVWGSKKLKALVVGGKRAVPVADVKGYREAYKQVFYECLKSSATRKYHELGTAENVVPLNEIGGLPTRNLRSAKFEGAELISGERFAQESLARRTACAHCPIACIHIASIRELYPGEKYFYVTRYISYDYEPIYALGSMLGISELDGVLKLIEQVDVLGLDAISSGVALAWVTEAFERGALSESETLVKPEWGDWRTYLRMLELIVEQPNDFYKLLAEGTERAAERYGCSDYALTFGGNEMPGYHTGPAAHIGYLIGLRHSHLDNAGYSLDQKYLGKAYPDPEVLVDELMEEEFWRQVLTSLVLCLFVRGVYKP
ncbi:MAG: aldehyde:ferredoxin oxidoreductase, partial [Candidatus Korarchaeum sp.]|nr:aldehyde:ferredoxin oxidoreductase [Candidatus Korarchaeum sp.]MDW8035036.1 aldehyde ferredoxin oxidoreductase N-terminal domain-containing protein [Candidatus Korarchaeum sp.]